MKKLLLLFAAGIALYTSCKKTTGENLFTDKLTKHNWYVDSVYQNGIYDSAGTTCSQNCYWQFTDSNDTGATASEKTGHQYYQDSPCGSPVTHTYFDYTVAFAGHWIVTTTNAYPELGGAGTAVIWYGSITDTTLILEGGTENIKFVPR